MNDVWTWGFIFDRLEDGRPLKVLTVTDEYTRESLAVEVGRSFSGGQVVDVLREISRERGVPWHIRSDNGSEVIAPDQKLAVVYRDRGHVCRRRCALAERLRGIVQQPISR